MSDSIKVELGAIVTVSRHGKVTVSRHGKVYALTMVRTLCTACGSSCWTLIHEHECWGPSSCINCYKHEWVKGELTREALLKLVGTGWTIEEIRYA